MIYRYFIFIIFGFLPQLLHPEWGLSAIRIAGRVLSDPVTARADIEGTLVEMVESALSFVKDHTQAIPNQLELQETAREYAPTAVREAAVNALVHRDWGLTGRTALRIFDDRLEIWNPGGPPAAHQLTLEELSTEGGISLPRNPLIAATCRFLGMGEQIGRGLPTMRRTVSESSGHQLAITTSKTDVSVTLPSALHTRERPS